jgi:hypothetical protein
MSLATRITNALNGTFAFNLFDDGVSDLLCLRNYQHGTSPGNYDSILRYGAQPKLGGHGGESALFRKIGERPLDNCPKNFFLWNHDYSFLKEAGARCYSIVSSLGAAISENDSVILKVLKIFPGIILGFNAPILKFRFRQNQLTNSDRPNPPKIRIYQDTTMSYASYTPDIIPPEHIGLPGSLKQGLNFNWKERIKENPRQFMKGIVKIIVSLAIMALFCIAVLHATRTIHWIDYNEQALEILLSIYGSFTAVQVLGRIFIPLVDTRLQVDMQRLRLA